MLGLPESTQFKKQVAKTLIYKKFDKELAGAMRTSFENDVSKIFLISEISSKSINILETENIKRIFFMQVELKTKYYDEKNIELMTRLFSQNVVLLLHYENMYQLLVNYIKLFKTKWLDEEPKLSIEGLDLDKVWEGFVSQISGIRAREGRSLDEEIRARIYKGKLEKKINSLNNKLLKEIQVKKKLELHKNIKALEKELEEI